MLISGKMSTAIRRIVTTLRTTISSDITTNVYGRLKASLTIHMAAGGLQRAIRAHPGRSAIAIGSRWE